MRALQLHKLWTHNSAAYSPTTMQLNQSVLSARLLGSTPCWDKGSWQQWCDRLVRSTAEASADSTYRSSASNVQKAVSPLVKQRSFQSKAVADWRQKSASAKTESKPRIRRHRTVITQKNGGKLVACGRKRPETL